MLLQRKRENSMKKREKKKLKFASFLFNKTRPTPDFNKTRPTPDPTPDDLNNFYQKAGSIINYPNIIILLPLFLYFFKERSFFYALEEIL